MKRMIILVVVVSFAASGAMAQSASSRAWQQRLQVEIPLPIPMVELESINPFTTDVDKPPVLLGSTAPRKVNVSGIASVAAFVDAKGECLGAVPLELPMPGLTSSLVQELTGSRFEAATAGNAPQPSWVVLEIAMEGKVKDPTIVRTGIEYMEALANWYLDTAPRSPVGFFQIGGGIAGDFPICVVPMLHQDMRRTDVPMWSYFCQISDSTTSYGSYSGAVPNEKITWGKLEADTPKFIIESDATIVAPLLFAWVLGW